ncbi:MAG: hypothetical protein WA702_28390 [Bradyrhizobium sp.]
MIFVNALVHVIAGLARKAIYNPGWLTAVFILPAAVHVGRLHAVRRE